MIVEIEQMQSDTVQATDQAELPFITVTVTTSMFFPHGGKIKLKCGPVPSTDSIEAEDAHDKEIEKFLSTVYVLCDAEQTRLAIDTVFDYFNMLIRGRKFQVCRSILSNIEVEKINSTLMVAFLSITLPVKDEIWTRPGFYARVRTVLVEERGDDRAARLLDKYE